MGQACVNGQCRGGGVCTAPSVCPEKLYCNEAEDCICVRTPEGDIRCGRRPGTCGDPPPRCQSSADCAHLGSGYFCDTPNTGCCGDELQRCIAPCQPTTSSCPAERNCSGICCAPGQQCASGVCQTACPTCGTCTSCSLDTATGTSSCAACDIPCTTADFCRKANQDWRYLRLASELGDQGFLPIEDPKVFVLREDSSPLRSVLGTIYTHLTLPGQTAALVYREEATGETVTFGLVYQDGSPTYAITIGASGQLERAFAPTASTVDSHFSGFAADPSHLLAKIAGNNALQVSSCDVLCNFACGVLIGQVACALVTMVICPASAFAGPGGLILCALTVGTMCEANVFAGCLAICELGICAPPAKSYCPCKGSCYDGMSACLVDCRGGLNCFAESCRAARPGEC
jgi:hypothetical protein